FLFLLHFRFISFAFFVLLFSFLLFAFSFFAFCFLLHLHLSFSVSFLGRVQASLGPVNLYLLNLLNSFRAAVHFSFGTVNFSLFLLELLVNFAWFSSLGTTHLFLLFFLSWSC